MVDTLLFKKGVLNIINGSKKQETLKDKNQKSVKYLKYIPIKSITKILQQHLRIS